MTRRDRLGAGLLALALSVLLEIARGHADWGPSEGVYALTSRLLLDGGDLYGGLVASQPPWTYLFGAAVARDRTTRSTRCAWRAGCCRS